MDLLKNYFILYTTCKWSHTNSFLKSEKQHLSSGTQRRESSSILNVDRRSRSLGTTTTITTSTTFATTTFATTTFATTITVSTTSLLSETLLNFNDNLFLTLLVSGLLGRLVLLLCKNISLRYHNKHYNIPCWQQSIQVPPPWQKQQHSPTCYHQNLH